ncbi:MAG: radical SAM family heme chaperone HemW [Clostridia bacterium]|nr:radical SAM family heme chaperone HemW [Clostridia bacterium]
MVKSVYIHIPFCKQKCLYCDFNSFQNKEVLIDDYMKALYKECAKFSFSELETIYIGGGTPSFIDSKYIVELLKMLPNAKEITVEMNPCTVTKEKLMDYKNAGVNRISMGLQTTNDDILKTIGRVHTFEEFKKAYELVKEAGFENVNVDLMFGLPTQTIKDVEESLRYLISINPTHISCYSLILHADIFKNLPSDDDEREMYYLTQKLLKQAGYEQYEISNFSKVGYESMHNLAYWNQEEYVGLGAGASSYVNGKRYTNEANIEMYISKIDVGDEIKNIEEVQDEEDKLKEYVILRLRLVDGVSINKVEEKFGVDLIKKFEKEIERLHKLELVEICEKYNENFLRLTKKGMDFANQVWQEFI